MVDGIWQMGGSADYFIVLWGEFHNHDCVAMICRGYRGYRSGLATLPSVGAIP